MSETLTLSPDKISPNVNPSSTSSSSNALFEHPDKFVRRHIGPSPEETAAMLKHLSFSDLDLFISQVVHQQIRLTENLSLPAPLTEFEGLKQLRDIASKNQVFRNYIGMGYSDCITPPVIQR